MSVCVRDIPGCGIHERHVVEGQDAILPNHDGIHNLAKIQNSPLRSIWGCTTQILSQGTTSASVNKAACLKKLAHPIRQAGGLNRAMPFSWWDFLIYSEACRDVVMIQGSYRTCANLHSSVNNCNSPTDGLPSGGIKAYCPCSMQSDG